MNLKKQNTNWISFTFVRTTFYSTQMYCIVATISISVERGILILGKRNCCLKMKMKKSERGKEEKKMKDYYKMMMNCGEKIKIHSTRIQNTNTNKTQLKFIYNTQINCICTHVPGGTGTLVHCVVHTSWITHNTHTLVHFLIYTRVLILRKFAKCRPFHSDF